MRFTAAAVVSGLAATVAAEAAIQHGPDAYGWGASSSAVASSTPVAAATPSKAPPAPVYVTEVVTAFTTYCPEATVITHKGTTYSVTSATTLTITNCPGGCTVTKPAYTTPAAPTTPVVVPSKPAVSSAPVVSKASSVPYAKPSSAAPPKSTGWATTSAPVSSPTTPAPYKGAASKTTFGFAGLIAAVGLVAAL